MLQAVPAEPGEQTFLNARKIPQFCSLAPGDLKPRECLQVLHPATSHCDRAGPGRSGLQGAGPAAAGSCASLPADCW